jgi:hypothetical protein
LCTHRISGRVKLREQTLPACAAEAATRKEQLTLPFVKTGGSMMPDGQTRRHRDMNNTTLAGMNGSVHVLTTHAKGEHKNAEWLKNDLVKALQLVGEDRVFLVVGDGAKACINSMKLFVALYPRVLNQRCAAHAFSLIFSKVAKLDQFNGMVKISLRLCAFVMSSAGFINEFVSTGANALKRPADTRMAKFAILVGAIEEDKDELEVFFASPKVKALVASSTAAKKAEYASLKSVRTHHCTPRQPLLPLPPLPPRAARRATHRNCSLAAMPAVALFTCIGLTPKPHRLTHACAIQRQLLLR